MLRAIILTIGTIIRQSDINSVIVPPNIDENERAADVTQGGWIGMATRSLEKSSLERWEPDGQPEMAYTCLARIHHQSRTGVEFELVEERRGGGL